MTESLDEVAAARITRVNGMPTDTAVVRGTVPGFEGELRFDVTATGRDCVAVVLFADENGDGELDLDVRRRPVEPYGVGQASWGDES